MRRLPYATAGLPRRGFAPPRNDNMGEGVSVVGRYGWIAASGCRLPLNDRVWWAGLFRPSLGIPQLHAVIASPLRAWQSSRGRYAGCLSDAEVAGWFRWIAASGCRLPRNDRVWWAYLPTLSLRAH